mmetsp:Transcript_9583/g.25894  ORF Transcript_9583/g.25894 Transcript_9583/m.25894 type:complete len:424 (-) Transcript_9583:30-1301(-)
MFACIGDLLCMALWRPSFRLSMADARRALMGEGWAEELPGCCCCCCCWGVDGTDEEGGASGSGASDAGLTGLPRRSWGGCTGTPAAAKGATTSAATGAPQCLRCRGGELLAWAASEGVRWGMRLTLRSVPPVLRGALSGCLGMRLGLGGCFCLLETGELEGWGAASGVAGAAALASPSAASSPGVPATSWLSNPMGPGSEVKGSPPKGGRHGMELSTHGGRCFFFLGLGEAWRRASPMVTTPWLLGPGRELAPAPSPGALRFMSAWGALLGLCTGVAWRALLTERPRGRACCCWSCCCSSSLCCCWSPLEHARRAMELGERGRCTSSTSPLFRAGEAFRPALGLFSLPLCTADRTARCLLPLGPPCLLAPAASCLHQSASSCWNSCLSVFRCPTFISPRAAYTGFKSLLGDIYPVHRKRAKLA